MNAITKNLIILILQRETAFSENEIFVQSQYPRHRVNKIFKKMMDKKYFIKTNNPEEYQISSCGKKELALLIK